MRPTDVFGRDLYVGARVGVAFSYSQASVGTIRIGVLEEMTDPESFRVRWEVGQPKGGTLSPKMRYGSASRWVIL